MLRVQGPLLVHCSAGIGRSGTFITIDAALAHIEKGLEVRLDSTISCFAYENRSSYQLKSETHLNICNVKESR